MYCSVLCTVLLYVKPASTTTKELAYKILVRPQLKYVATVWAPWWSIVQQSLERIQCCAARFVAIVTNPIASVTDLFYQDTLDATN